MKRRPLLWVCSLLALGAMAYAQTYDLREHYEPHQVLVVSFLLNAELKVVSSEPEGFEKMFTGVFRYAQQSEVRYRILEAPDGFPSLQRAYVVSAEEVDEEPGKPPARTISPLVGKVVLVRVPPTGDATFEGAQGQAIDQADAKNWCDDLPAGVLEGVDTSSSEVGDEWDIPESVLAKRFDLSEQGTASAHARFAEVIERDGRRFARVELTATVNDILAGEDADQPMSMELTGDYLFDLERSLSHAVALEGTVTTEAEVSQPDMKLRIRMQGPMRVTYTVAVQ